MAEATVERKQRTWIRWQLYLSFLVLGIGGLFGVLQALDRLGIDLYTPLQPAIKSYYQGLTIHGVALAIAFTFTFNNAFLSLTTLRGLARPLASTALLQASFWTALAGVVLAAAMMLANQASVLFTFYTPLQANPLFYLGATLLVVSTWLTSANQLLTLRAWRQEHPGERIPLLAFVSVVTYLMWDLASLGIAVEVVGFVLPWSLGLLKGTDPLFNRTLFWFTGHPIVYFWLLPVYISWYLMIPRQVEGRLFSDGLVRAVFIMFLVLSVPVGLHHQYTDPGVYSSMKFLHAVLTFAVFFPSMVTAFTVVAALESGGRARGGRGLLGWIPRLPWGKPEVSAQLLAMIAFALGGASGLINASYTMNLVVHNTSFVPGHFHLTVGTAVALSIMGIAYWLVPYLTGKELFGRGLALVQSWLFFIGVLLFARGQMAGGLEGQPRRLFVTQAAYASPAWRIPNIMTGVGGLFMVLSGVLFFAVLLGTLLRRRRAEQLGEFPLAEVIYGPERTPAVLDRLGAWLGAAALLVLIAYAPTLVSEGVRLLSPGFRLY